MKVFRKILTLALTVGLAFSLTACNNGGEGGSQGIINSSGAIGASDNVSSIQSSAQIENSSQPVQSTSQLIEQTESSAQTNQSQSQSSEQSSEQASGQTSTQTASTELSPPSTPSAEPSTPEPLPNNVLVAYFSWSGNTEQLAEMISQKTGGDLFEISPQNLYTDDYNDLLDVAQEEQRSNARPRLSARVDNWEQYDYIFVGYPNWWNDAPMVVLSFLESYDCNGKTIVPFCTSGGGGFGRSMSSIRESAAGATVPDGFHVNGSRVSSARSNVESWIDGLSIG